MITEHAEMSKISRTFLTPRNDASFISTDCNSNTFTKKTTRNGSLDTAETLKRIATTRTSTPHQTSRTRAYVQESNNWTHLLKTSVTAGKDARTALNSCKNPPSGPRRRWTRASMALLYTGPRFLISSGCAPTAMTG